MAATQKRIGDKGERFVARYLRWHGYLILARNYRTATGEVDIICSNRKYLCFVEVKTRSEKSNASPEEMVNIFKQRRIIKATRNFLHKNRYEKYVLNKMYRFDVAVVTYNEKGKMKLNYMENAFSPSI